jgi:hypothetical protein
MGMRRNIQALARPILPDEFGVWSFTNYVATPTNPKVLIYAPALPAKFVDDPGARTMPTKAGPKGRL